jgi:hypothetical protein
MEKQSMNDFKKLTHVGAATLLTLLPGVAMAQDELSAGDTAWMLTATALVLFMTIPGLSLFYAGMVRAKNALSVMMQCFAITCLITILWVVYLYSMAFGNDIGGFVGDFSKAFMVGVGVEALSGTIPETVFSVFQLTFAIITPALIVGAFAERMKFSAMLWFMTLWVTGRARLRGRHRSAHQRRCGRPGGGPGHGQAAWLPSAANETQQPGIDHGRSGHVVGRLVRIQCRQRAGR